MKNKIISILKDKKTWLIIGAIVIVLVAYKIFAGSPAPVAVTTTVPTVTAEATVK